MRKLFLLFLLLTLALAPCASARMTGALVGGGVAAGLPAGTLLLGTNDTAASTGEMTANSNTAYHMAHTGQATATVAKAYWYERGGYNTGDIHICIWGSTGTLLGCSGAIAVGLVGNTWKSVDWSGPEIVADTSYYIGFVSTGGAGAYGYYDTSSPALPACGPDTTGQTYGSEGDIPGGTCSESYGSYLIYVTN